MVFAPYLLLPYAQGGQRLLEGTGYIDTKRDNWDKRQLIFSLLPRDEREEME